MSAPTYGKSKLSSTPSLESSTSLLFATASSSPGPSSDLVTPPTSPVASKRKATPEIVEIRDATSDPHRTTVASAKARTQSTLKGFFAPLPKRKDPLRSTSVIRSTPIDPISSAVDPQSSLSNAIISPAPAPAKAGPSKFTQLHLTHLPLLHTCHECQMSYVRGGDDEGVHQVHHTRVIRGIVWEGLGRGKGKGKADSGWRAVTEGISAGQKGGVKGRIIVADGSWGGSKLNDILSTVDTVLSAPALPTAILDQCKIFLFLTSSPPPLRTSKRPRPSDMNSKSPKERIVGVVVAQGIKWAMRVLRDGEEVEGGRVVDSGGGVICDPKSLPTPLGIHRLWTVPSYRGLGLGYLLLDASRKHTIYGCDFDPSKGHVAFSQPTESGRAVMERWGSGAVRVFVDDESQL